MSAMSEVPEIEIVMVEVEEVTACDPEILEGKLIPAGITAIPTYVEFVSISDAGQRVIKYSFKTFDCIVQFGGNGHDSKPEVRFAQKDMSGYKYKGPTKWEGSRGTDANHKRHASKNDSGHSFRYTDFQAENGIDPFPISVTVLDGKYVTSCYITKADNPISLLDKHVSERADPTVPETIEAIGNAFNSAVDQLRTKLSEPTPKGEQRFFPHGIGSIYADVEVTASQFVTVKIEVKVDDAAK